MSTTLYGSNVSSSAGTGSNVKYFVGILLFILLLVALYYLYNWMYGTNKSIISTPLLSSLTASTVASTLDPNSVAVVNLTGISQGGQYSVSMWVYVSSTKSNISNLVHLLDITGGTSTARAGNTLLFIGLDPANATLVVRQSSSGDGDTKMPAGSVASTPSSNSYSLSSIITGYMSSTSNSTSSYTQDDRCDIMNGIEYQRWVLVM